MQKRRAASKFCVRIQGQTSWKPAELLPDTRAYDGCLSVDVYQDQDNPGYICLVEDWESKVHQQRYQAWRDESGIAEVVGPFLAGEPRFNYFDKQDI